MQNPIAKFQALLFVSGEPVALLRISKILGISKRDVETLVDQLRKKLVSDEESGIFLIEHDGKIELATKGEYASTVESLMQNMHEENLSRAALEVLAIVAYRGPVTRSEVEAIRGVNCSFTLRNLLLRGLIERYENPDDNREFVYQPTLALMERIGIGSIQDLPQYDQLSRDARLSSIEASATLEKQPKDLLSTK